MVKGFVIFLSIFFVFLFLTFILHIYFSNTLSLLFLHFLVLVFFPLPFIYLSFFWHSYILHFLSVFYFPRFLCLSFFTSIFPFFFIIQKQKDVIGIDKDSTNEQRAKKNGTNYCAQFSQGSRVVYISFWWEDKYKSFFKLKLIILFVLNSLELYCPYDR